MVRVRVVAALVLGALLSVSTPTATGWAEDESDCYREGRKLVCEDPGGGPGGSTGGTVPVPEDAVWFIYYNTNALCYAVGWQVPGASLGYDGWFVLTEATFPIFVGLFGLWPAGMFSWVDFDEDGDGTWDGGEASAAANALFGGLDACSTPPTDEPWVLDFIETLDFTAGAVATAPPGDPVAGWPAYVTLEPDYGPLEATGGVVVDDADGSTSVRWDLTNPHTGNVITVTADPIYRVYWDVEGQPDLHTESTRGDVTWPAEGEGELAHRYQTKGPRDILGQVRWQVEWETPVASGTEEFVRETPHQWTVEEYQGVVDG